MKYEIHPDYFKWHDLVIKSNRFIILLQYELNFKTTYE